MLNLEFTIGQGDTVDPLRFTVLSEDEETPIDLGGLTATFTMEDELGRVLIDDKAAVIDDNPTTGKVSYEWAEGDTVKAGVHRGRFRFIDPEDTTRVFSAPNEDYIVINVTPFSMR